MSRESAVKNVGRRGQPRGIFKKLLEINRGSGTADDPVRPRGQWSLVDDGVEDLRRDALAFAPVLRENVVNVDVLVKEDSVCVWLARAEVFRASPHQ